MDVIPTADGIDIQMWLATPRAEAHVARHRHIAGPTGCGLCGVDSLAEATRQPPAVGEGIRIDCDCDLRGNRARSLRARLCTGRRALCTPRDSGVLGDGHRLRARGRRPAQRSRQAHRRARAPRRKWRADGVLLLTSRVSVEMVQKAAVLGVSILVAVSAPTALAIRTAAAAGITLVAIARSDGFEVFTHPRRILSTAQRRESLTVH